MRDCNAGYQFLKVPKMSTVTYIPKARQVETSMNISNIRWSVVIFMFVYQLPPGHRPWSSGNVQSQVQYGTSFPVWQVIAVQTSVERQNRRPKPYCAHGPHNSTGSRLSALVCKILGRGSLLRSLTSDLCIYLVVDGRCSVKVQLKKMYSRCDVQKSGWQKHQANYRPLRHPHSPLSDRIGFAPPPSSRSINRTGSQIVMFGSPPRVLEL